VAERVADLVDDLLDQDAVVALAHHPDHRLGAGGADQQAALAVEALFAVNDRRFHPGMVERLAERLVQQFHPGALPADYRHEGGAFRSADPEALSLAAGERTIAQLFVDAGLASSKSEARRLAGQRGISINEQPVSSAEEKVTPQDGWVLRRGSHRVVRLKLR